ncbi:MAG: FliH/SctL family protein [Candidatus Hydrogenedentota bacterium]
MSENIFKNPNIKIDDNVVVLKRPKLRTEILYEEEEKKKVLREILLKESEEIKEAQSQLEALQKEAAEIIGRAENKADEILKKIEADCNNKIVEAERKEKEILELAQNEKQKIITEANSEKQRIIEEFQKQGYDSGYKQGFEKISKEALSLLKQADKVLEKSLAIKHYIIDTARGDLLNVIRLICNKILHKEISLSPEVITPRVEYALKKLQEKEKIVVRIHPDSIPELEGHREHFYKEIRGLDHLVFKEDPSLELGDCILETDFGSIDSRVESEVLEITERLDEIGLDLDYLDNVEKQLFPEDKNNGLPTN